MICRTPVLVAQVLDMHPVPTYIASTSAIYKESISGILDIINPSEACDPRSMMKDRQSDGSCNNG